jgi:hypothetical protein
VFSIPEPWLKSQTMGDSFYHIFATLYLLFIWTVKSRNFNFVNKLRKIDVCFQRHNQNGVVKGAKLHVRFLTLFGVEILSAIIEIYHTTVLFPRSKHGFIKTI